MPLACSRIGLRSSAAMSSRVSSYAKAPVLLTARLLAFVNVVLVGPELTQGAGHVTGCAGVAGPRDRCSLQSRLGPAVVRGGR
jgi:hypothetical protein